MMRFFCGMTNFVYGVTAIFLVALCVLCLPEGRAQLAGALLSGTISDASGASIAGAQLEIKNIENGEVRTVVSNGDGFYSAPNLLPGNYDVSVSANGFAGLTEHGVILKVGMQQKLDLTLTVGEVRQNVEVSSAAPTIDTTTSVVSGQVDEKTILELPLNGRSWTQLATLQPGVTSVRAQTSTSATTTNRGNRGYGDQLSDNGHRPNDNTYRVDGISVNDYTNAGPGNVLGGALGVDAVREFNVVTTNYTAEYGRTAGAVINAITKSGTNSLHGSAYLFDRDKIFDARNFFDPSVIPPFRRLQFGASAGAPIIKDKTFIFGDFEAIRQGQSGSIHTTVLSDAARAGQMCSTPNGTCTAHQLTGSLNPDPATGIDTAVLPYLALYPRANGGLVPGGNGNTAFFNAGQLVTTNDNYFTIGVDHKISDQDMLNGTYFFYRTPQLSPDTLLDIKTEALTQRQMIGVTETHIFSSAIVNAARIGFSRNVGIVAQSAGAINPAAGDKSLGLFPGLYAPTISVSGLALAEGVGAAAFFDHRFNSYQAYDDLFLSKGKHSLQMGFAFERMQYNVGAVQHGNGAYTFTSLTGFPNAIEDFLTNRPKRVQVLATNPRREVGTRDSLFGGYFQDTWRVTRKFTLNAGLRYEMLTLPTETHGNFGTILDLAGGTTQPVSTRFLSNPSKANFEPRIGFAWDPFGTGKTVIRSGFGIFDILPLPYIYTARDAFSLPNELQVTVSNMAQGSFPNHFPFDPAHPSASDIAAATTRFVDPHPPRSYSLSWNLNIQHEFSPGVTAMIGYVGSRVNHEPVAIDDANQVLPTVINGVQSWPIPIGSGTPINPNVGAIQAIFFDGTTKYNALQGQVRVAGIHHLQTQISYSYGKCLDDGSGAIVGDPFLNSISSLIFADKNMRHGPCDFDLRQNLSVNTLYELPGPSAGFAKAALGGWQIGGILTASTGVPMSLVFDGDPLGLNSSDPYDFPSRVKGCNPINSNFKQNGMNYLNLSCFTLPTPPSGYTGSCQPFSGIAGTCQNLLGNNGRNQIYGPKLVELDLSLIKNFRVQRISERFGVEFRADAFNVLNHPNFLPPVANNVLGVTSTGSLTGISGAGQISQTATSSRQIQLAVKVIW
jgi:Carboxypeptidase regulatory-like domain